MLRATFQDGCCEGCKSGFSTGHPRSRDGCVSVPQRLSSASEERHGIWHTEERLCCHHGWLLGNTESLIRRLGTHQ